MKIKKLLIVVALLVVAFTLIIIVGIFVLSQLDPTWPVVNASTPPDLQEVAAIQAVVTRSIDIEGIGLTAFDLSQYPTVFVDDPTIRLDKQYDDYANEVQKRVKGFVNNHGWLSFRMAIALNQKSGVTVSQYFNTANAMGQTVSRNDYATFGAYVPPSGVNPTPPGVISYTLGNSYQPTWGEFKIAGNQAEVIYNECTGFKAFLIKTKDGWRIAGSRIVKECRG